MEVICKVKRGNRISHYMVRDRQTEFEMSKQEVIAAINNGRITNAKVQLVNGKPMVRVRLSHKVEYEPQPTMLKSMIKFSILSVLSKTKPGTPIRIKVEDLDWIQTIYTGYDSDGVDKWNNEYFFYDGQGITGMWSFTARYIVNNPDSIHFDFTNIDEHRAKELLSVIGEFKG